MFEYPLDINNLLNKTLTIKKKLLKKNNKLRTVLKIYILSGSTTNKLIEVLEIFLLNYGIKPVFEISEYDRYYETAVFKKNKILEFGPDIIYIHTSFFNLKYVDTIFNSGSNFKEIIHKEFQVFKEIWTSLNDIKCSIIQNNFEFPYFRNNGNFDALVNNGKTKYVLEINKLFSEYASINKKVLINDINYLSSLYGLESWYDYNLWFSYKYAFSFDVIPYISQSIFSLIKYSQSDFQKVLITDLDNTIWGGVIGDDGFENIKLGSEDPISESFLEVQKFIKSLSKRGIILGINSKNDYKKAIEGFKNKNSKLNENDFSIIKSNWKPKNINMKEIIKFLNISEDQIVYIDDSPFEREIVKNNFKNISVPEIKDPEEAINFILHLERNFYFQSNTNTNEDNTRNKYYKQIEKWENKKEEHQNYETFLKEMNMYSTVYSSSDEIFDRIFQLINKTNQFNLLKSRVDSIELKKQLQSKNKVFLGADLNDKFGNYGITNIIIGKIEKNNCYINHWVMSCRVFERTFEHFIFNIFVDVCINRKVSKITAKFIPSTKNKSFENIYFTFGFKNIFKSNEFSEWELDLKNFKKLKTFISPV